MDKSKVFVILTLLCGTVSIVLVFCLVFCLIDNSLVQIIGGADKPTLIYLIETYLLRGWGLGFLIFAFTLIIGSAFTLFRKCNISKKIVHIYVISLAISILLCRVILPILFNLAFN